jgi:hypothetical protein
MAASKLYNESGLPKVKTVLSQGKEKGHQVRYHSQSTQEVFMIVTKPNCPSNPYAKQTQFFVDDRIRWIFENI